MAWKTNHLTVNRNMQLANVFSNSGQLEQIGGYLCAGGKLLDFMISGGTEAEERYLPVYPVLDFIIGKMPVVVLHTNHIYMEEMVSEVWYAMRDMEEDFISPLWVCNNDTPCFEPFYGMADMLVIAVLRQLAVKLNYIVTPRFERTVRAHLSILKELEIPNSLSGLYYLCQFYDIGEFHENVMALPCGETKARRIWADLGVDDESGNGQFDLFRAVIHNLAHDAGQSGWKSDRTVCDCNCLQAIEKNGAIVLSVNDMYSNLLLAYLTEELKVHTHTPFFLLIDGVKFSDENMLEYLCAQNTGCRLGIISENAVDQIGSDEDAFFRLAERMNCFIFFKHNTGKTAAVISEVFGKYDYMKAEASQGVSRGIFSIIPRDRHEDIRYTTENRYRVMPEEILGLGSSQAIIFDTDIDQIIYFNM